MEAVISIAKLNRQFEVPGVAKIVEGNGGLPKVCITTNAAQGEVYLHGAQVTSWKPTGSEEVFFLSKKSHWQDGVAIRGGVPISFPWFAEWERNPRAPAHGFVRTKTWQLESILNNGHSVSVSMFTMSDENTRKWATGEFRLTHRATFGQDLRLELIVQNLGATTLRFEEALHAYYRVGDLSKARIRGLNNVRFIDKTDARREKAEQGDLVVASETDRIYLDAPPSVQLIDETLHRSIRATGENSMTTSVWNPWSEKAQTMPDLDADEWGQFLCIETNNVSAFAVNLAPGQDHRMKVTVSVVPM
jgi:glucose-6-phosphate 1-epimerase